MEKLFNAPGLAVAGVLLVVSTARAQPFTYKTGDLALTFRKVGVYQENYEAVANIGQVFNYLNLPVGTTVTVTNVAPSQLVTNSFDDFNNLKWAVIGATDYTNTGTFPGYTLWVTVPRRNVSVKSITPPRDIYTVQSATQGVIASLLFDARLISNALGTSNAVNNVYFVREPWAEYSQITLSVSMGSRANVTIGTLQDNWVNGDLEKTTPISFTNGFVRSDLYEVRPTTDKLDNPVVDPHTGLSSGPAYYVGYFDFNFDGTITFKRDVAGTRPPPPPPLLSITRTGTVSTISFVSSNTAVYKLFFTNSAALTAPIVSWPSASGTITGDGTTKSFQDDSTALDRVYRVQGQ